MANRGRRRQAGVERYASGRKRAESPERLAERQMATAVDARMRVFGVTRDAAKSQEAGSVVGRMVLNGELALGEQGQEMLAAADHFREVRSGYERAIDARHLGTCTDYTGTKRPDWTGAGTSEAYADWCASMRSRYADVRRAVLECGDPVAMLALEHCVMDDRPPRGEIMLGALRCGLNAVARAMRSARRTAA